MFTSYPSRHRSTSPPRHVNTGGGVASGAVLQRPRNPIGGGNLKKKERKKKKKNASLEKKRLDQYSFICILPRTFAEVHVDYRSFRSS